MAPPRPLIIGSVAGGVLPEPCCGAAAMLAGALRRAQLPCHNFKLLPPPGHVRLPLTQVVSSLIA